MIPYQTKSKKISGTSYGEVKHNAFLIYSETKKKKYFMSCFPPE